MSLHPVSHPAGNSDQREALGSAATACLWERRLLCSRQRVTVSGMRICNVMRGNCRKNLCGRQRNSIHGGQRSFIHGRVLQTRHVSSSGPPAERRGPAWGAGSHPTRAQLCSDTENTFLEKKKMMKVRLRPALLSFSPPSSFGKQGPCQCQDHRNSHCKDRPGRTHFLTQKNRLWE
ncbi:uncharacterized protein J5F26_008455 [Ciconia maguari]